MDFELVYEMRYNPTYQIYQKGREGTLNSIIKIVLKFRLW